MTVIAIRPAMKPIAPKPEPVAPLVDKWLSAQEIADARLPGMPKNKRKVNELAARERWAFRVAPDGSELARTRKGRGGGLEYHVDLLPPQARALVLKGQEAAPSAEIAASNDAKASIWSWYEQQSSTTQNEARRRLAVIDAVEAGIAAGLTRSAAVTSASAHYAVSGPTIWNWLRQIAGIARHDWLAHLAPRRIGGGKERDVDQVIWTALISDYLRPEKPTWESCYYRAKRKADAEGLTLPSSRTLFRKMEREVDPLVRVKRRDGREALQRTMPPQVRSVANLHALEIVNIDGHRWDVFVRWPNGKIARPTMVAIQDVMSRKILAWRIDETENAVCTRLAFADLFREYGIPKVCVLDNGRAFASKWITGGAKTRYRFKIRPDDPIGLLPALGVQARFATPYHGQAKPIERAFRDMADAISRHPALAGAYTGSNPQAKPENYGDKAVDLNVFIDVLKSEIAAHNAKEGRRTEMANGRSFDAIFAESYARAPIGKATPEQLRLALLTAADNIRTHRKDGSIRIEGNVYWCSELSRFAGDQVTVRFDPDNLHSEIHVYKRDGRFIATVPIWEAQGFADMAAANRLKKARKDWRKAAKDAEAKLGLLDGEELAASMPVMVGPDLPEPSIVRPVRHRGQTAAALKPDLAVVEPPLNAPKKPAAIDRLVAAHARLKLVD